jgi:hypothetical protein
MGKIEPPLLALADSVRSFKEDADLEVCLGKCTIYMPGILKEHAHQLIRDCIDADESGTLETLRPMLAHDLDVIQVQGLCIVGTPMGASQDVLYTFGSTHEANAAPSAMTSNRCASAPTRSLGTNS